MIISTKIIARTALSIFLIFLTISCTTGTSEDIFWIEKDGQFYTNDLARAQEKVPFPIILPSYVPGTGKGKPAQLIEGPLVQSDNTAEVTIGYEVHVNSPAPSDIRVTETSWQSWHPERQGLRTSLINIGDKQVTKTEIDQPSGTATLFGFNSNDVYFFVEIYNLSPDEAMKIVESIIVPTAGSARTSETVAVPETETESVPETKIILEADVSSVTLPPENAIADTITVIEGRLQGLGISEATVEKQDDDLIVVRLPKVKNVDELVTVITSRGQLDFRELVADDNGSPVLDDKGEQQWTVAKAAGNDGQEAELTGKYLKPNAQVVISQQYNEPEVAFEWNREGAVLFEQITQRNLMKPLGIFLDDKLISAPTVRAVIKDKGVITGLTLENAKALAIQLNSGALPAPLRVVSIEPNGKD